MCVSRCQYGRALALMKSGAPWWWRAKAITVDIKEVAQKRSSEWVQETHTRWARDAGCAQDTSPNHQGWSWHGIHLVLGVRSHSIISLVQLLSLWLQFAWWYTGIQPKVKKMFVKNDHLLTWDFKVIRNICCMINHKLCIFKSFYIIKHQVYKYNVKCTKNQNGHFWSMIYKKIVSVYFKISTLKFTSNFRIKIVSKHCPSYTDIFFSVYEWNFTVWENGFLWIQKSASGISRCSKQEQCNLSNCI